MSHETSDYTISPYNFKNAILFYFSLFSSIQTSFQELNSLTSLQNAGANAWNQITVDADGFLPAGPTVTPTYKTTTCLYAEELAAPYCKIADDWENDKTPTCLATWSTALLPQAFQNIFTVSNEEDCCRPHCQYPPPPPNAIINATICHSPSAVPCYALGRITLSINLTHACAIDAVNYNVEFKLISTQGPSITAVIATPNSDRRLFKETCLSFSAGDRINPSITLAAALSLFVILLSEIESENKKNILLICPRSLGLFGASDKMAHMPSTNNLDLDIASKQTLARI